MATLGGCNSDSMLSRLEETRAPGDLNILQLDQLPTLITDSASFWAVRGQDRAVEIFFADSLGQPGDRLLRFEVGGSSLALYPDGRKFGDGDSVLISIHITDPSTLAFDFGPSGLRFKSKDPARLTVAYGGAPIDAENEVGIWMQEQANSVYTRLVSRVDAILQEVEADVPGFSRYAVAY
jgi:hypothetical protein